MLKPLFLREYKHQVNLQDKYQNQQATIFSIFFVQSINQLKMVRLASYILNTQRMISKHNTGQSSCPVIKTLLIILRPCLVLLLEGKKVLLEGLEVCLDDFKVLGKNFEINFWLFQSWKRSNEEERFQAKKRAEKGLIKKRAFAWKLQWRHIRKLPFRQPRDLSFSPIAKFLKIDLNYLFLL